jgi:hypothetical protein
MAGVASYLFGVEVNETVSSGLALQRSRLVEQEVKLFHLPKPLHQLHQVVPVQGGREKNTNNTAVRALGQ